MGIPSPIQNADPNVEMAKTLTMMDTFRLFDKSNSGKVAIDDFVNGILDHLLQLKKNNETILDIAISLCTAALAITRRNHGSDLIFDETVQLSIDSILAITSDTQEKVNKINLFSHFISSRLESMLVHNGNDGISVTILSR